MIYKSDVVAAMTESRFDDPMESPHVVEHMHGLITAFFQGAEQQDVATAMLGALMLRRVSDAFLAAVHAADARN